MGLINIYQNGQNIGSFLAFKGEPGKKGDTGGGIHKYTESIDGDNDTKVFYINHNLNSQEILWAVYDEDTFKDVPASVTRTDENNIEIEFTESIPLGSSYNVVVFTSTPPEGEVGNMKKSTYDQDGDGIVDNAKNATHYKKENESIKLEEEFDNIKANLNDLPNTYMTINNPTGSGSVSINRKNNEVTGEFSATLGYENSAQGRSSMAVGENTAAKGDYSFAEGLGTIATGECQHVAGYYNVEDTSSTYAQIIGNGDSDNSRKNIYTLDWFGNIFTAGHIELMNGSHLIEGLSASSIITHTLPSTGGDILNSTTTFLSTTYSNGLKVADFTFNNNSTSLFIPIASIDQNGVVTNEAQTFGGSKTFNDTVTISGATTLNSTLTVSSTATFNGSISAKAATFSGAVLISGSNTLTVGGATTLNSTLTVSSTATFNGSISAKAATFAGAVSISGSSNTLTVSGATALKSTLTVSSIATFNGAVLISGSTNTLTVGGSATFSGKIFLKSGTSYTYSTSLPTSGTTGQLFFKLI